MVTGQRPFSGRNATDTIQKIINAQPEAVARLNGAVDAEFERIVRKCLAKRRDERYHSTRDLLVDLRSLKQATVTRVQPRAVNADPATTSNWRNVWIALPILRRSALFIDGKRIGMYPVLPRRK